MLQPASPVLLHVKTLILDFPAVMSSLLDQFNDLGRGDAMVVTQRKRVAQRAPFSSGLVARHSKTWESVLAFLLVLIGDVWTQRNSW